MFKKYLLPMLLVVVLTLTSFAPAFASEVGPVEPLTPAPSAETGQIVADETPSLWFVELKSAPLIEGSRPAQVQAEQQKFRVAARSLGVAYIERYQYTQLWNGFSVSISASQVGKLRRIPGVKAIYPVMKVPMPETTKGANNPDLFTALAMTGADIVQSELGFTGKGIKVAVMDTGIDYDHKALGGDGVARSNSSVFPTKRVIKGWDFVGDAYNADDTSPSYNPIPVPDKYPDDCYGHGTHVAGIIGANDPTNSLKGVAPNVKFGSYRVFGCDGSTTDDIMLAAMERAYKDGMDVLNMSIGSAFEWPQSPTAVAASRLVQKGMVVVASIGNSGANGLYSAGAPGLGENVIGVASFDNTSITQQAFSVSPDNTLVGFNPAAAAPIPPTSGTYSIARTGTITTTNDACAEMTAGSLTGKIALIRRGTCFFYDKALNAQNAGAIGVVLYNNQPGSLSPTVAGEVAITIPVVFITAVDGVLINSRLDSGSVDLTWGAGTVSAVDPNGGLISSFSSYGLSPDLALKPDLGAPGGNIYSTFPLEQGGYATLSGTSMSSPHVAGAAALLLEADKKSHTKDVDADEVMSILQNSAEPADWWGYPGVGYLDSVNRQGAGMLRIDRAVLATTIIEPGKLSLGESQQGPVTRKLKIENHNKKAAVTYDLSFVNALSTSGVITPDFWEFDATVTFSAPSVTVKPHSESKIDVTITPATGPDLQAQYGGYIIFTPRDGGQVYRVPFAGFVGDYQSIQVLTSGKVYDADGNLVVDYGLPWLVDQNWNDATTFTMVNGDLPYFVVHFEHQSRVFRMEAFDAVTGKSKGEILDFDFWVRNSTSTGVYEFPWDGTTTNGRKVYTMPNGQYVVKIFVLKALGSRSVPTDWETWTSPVLTIARP